MQPWNGDGSLPNDNRLYQQHPTLSSAGLTLIFDSAGPVQLPYDVSRPVAYIPPLWFSTISGSPPGERYVDQSLVDFSSFVYQPSKDQWHITEPSSLPCALPAVYQGQLSQQQYLAVQHNSSLATLIAVPSTVVLYFYYSAVPPTDTDMDAYGSAWSICASGSITAIGPYSYGNNVVYQALTMTGQRLFLDEKGVSSVSAITAISTEDSANQLLYAGRPPYYDTNGITFALSPTPLFPNSFNELAFNWIHLSNGSGETSGFTTPSSTVSFVFSALQRSLLTCLQPGDGLQASQNGWIMVLVVVIPMLGLILCVMCLELVNISFRRRQLASMMGWLMISIAAVAFCSWAAYATYYASISIDSSTALSPVTVQYRLDYMLLGWVPCGVGVAAAMIIMLMSLKLEEQRRLAQVCELRSHPDYQHNGSTMSTITSVSVGSKTRASELGLSMTINESDTSQPQGEAEDDAEESTWMHRVQLSVISQRTKAKLTMQHLYSSFTYYILLAGLALTAAMALTATR